jgi:UDP-glucuronate 4-epimerase
MKILVTGVAGFIGSHVAERLCMLGHGVTGIDNFSSYYSPALKEKNADQLRSAGIRLVRADLRDSGTYDELPVDFDYIFHFAAHPGISKSSSFEDYLGNNIIATQQIVKFAETCSALKLFVNISTSSVYGKDATKDETTVPMPVSDYGVTKLAAEQTVLAAARNNKFKACSLRLYSVYGPRERPDKLFTKLIRCLLNDEAFPLFEGSEQHVRSFTYVSDIVDGVISVLGKENEVNGEIINIGSDIQHTTREGIKTAEMLTGRVLHAEMFPARSGDQTGTKAVIDKARKLLNYDPRTNLEEGLRAQIDWILNGG